ncbi:MAG: polymer-forming cytoskeletal protein [Roseburia sp.]
MSFFKDFKEDLSQAVNELLPGDEGTLPEEEQDVVVNTLEEELDVQSELSKLDGLLEKVSREAEKPAQEPKTAEPEKKEEPLEEPKTEKVVSAMEQLSAAQSKAEEPETEEAEAASEEQQPETEAEADEPTAQPEAPAIELVMNTVAKTTQEEKKMSDITVDTMTKTETPAVAPASTAVTDEVTVITESTSITGNMSSTGSFDVRGTINGNIDCNGKLQVTGTLKGNSQSAEFFADAAKVEGEVVSTGTVKIGLGSVIIGNITATSAVIAGAIKGDIDVQGPVVVDTSAVVMGNIKSRSVQINNGAVIEGFCSQCYAEIDVESLFGDAK